MVKTAELTGALLDYWVGMAEGRVVRMEHYEGDGSHPIDKCILFEPNGSGGMNRRTYRPSTDWAQGGPIMDRDGINPWSYQHEGERYWSAHMEGQSPVGAHGCKSMLIAGLRAKVASVYGEEVPY
jgi:hypothetical protein